MCWVLCTVPAFEAVSIFRYNQLVRALDSRYSGMEASLVCTCSFDPQDMNEDFCQHVVDPLGRDVGPSGLGSETVPESRIKRSIQLVQKRVIANRSSRPRMVY